MVRVKGNKINGVECVALEGMTKEGHECAQKIKEKDKQVYVRTQTKKRSRSRTWILLK